jgi:hypothetical protein
MGSCARNLPLYTKVSTAKLKLSEIEGLTTLRPLIKESYELSLGIMVFFVTTKYHLLVYSDVFRHFETLTFFHNYNE